MERRQENARQMKRHSDFLNEKTPSSVFLLKLRLLAAVGEDSLSSCLDDGAERPGHLSDLSPAVDPSLPPLSDLLFASPHYE